jgi:restriction system protein
VTDHGIDVIAERDGRRLGVQAKTWAGANRKINSQLVMTVYGSARFHDCAEAMIATDADVLPDARQVAAKLGVEIRYVAASPRPPLPPSRSLSALRSAGSGAATSPRSPAGP